MFVHEKRKLFGVKHLSLTIHWDLTGHGIPIDNSILYTPFGVNNSKLYLRFEYALSDRISKNVFKAVQTISGRIGDASKKTGWRFPTASQTNVFSAPLNSSFPPPCHAQFHVSRFFRSWKKRSFQRAAEKENRIESLLWNRGPERLLTDRSAYLAAAHRQLDLVAEQKFFRNEFGRKIADALSI